jgi:AcrR family transcriptional regulator
VGRGQLYHFFCDKQDLVAEVVAQQVERVLAPQQPALDAMAGPEDVRAWCQVAVELHERAEDPVRCPIGTLVHELGEDDPVAREALADGFGRWRGALAEGLARLEARGGLRPGVRAERLAVGLLAAYQGGVLLAAACDDVTLLRDALAATVEPALAS